jgi:hypothetical protein
MKNITSRRALLRAALSLSVILGTGALAHAASDPFLPNTNWSGNAGSVGAANVTLDVTWNVMNTSGGTLTLNGISKPVSIVWNQQGGVEITSPYITISGQVGPQAISYGLTGTYTTKNYPGTPNVTNGLFSLKSLSNSGLVSDDPTMANIPSISIVPPDFKGLLESKYTGLVESALSTSGGTQPARVSLVSGKTVLNGMGFNYVMTFAPTPNADGSFSFDLLGNNNQPGSPTAFVAMSGFFFPSTSRTSASMGGSFQLLGLKGNTVDLGGFSLVAAQ